ncbi:DNA-J related domain-containing protein [Thalassolituus sp. UBA2009]|uniref:DNA-J related domain-containing protein n=1 Tax=Thalassolituus sp. UBA2009 TaxID=1947658 RepID=UPI000C686ED6|nr:DNA-J related domain-containing protein [Thalassolituus sp. UBA2009]MAY15032.1 molecular chaperone DnaJ [Oceanospirillaceae bacterium]|tara:strand:+ start:636 stop:1256 length:621 start_codon:yes stop_codon:yes gene_type:complete
MNSDALSSLAASDSATDDFAPLLELLNLYLADGQSHTEYDVLCWLQASEQGVFRADALRDSLTMFRSHFILMHCLYRLQQQWAAEQTALLEISALRICRSPWPDNAHNRGLTEHSPLAQYYLDLSQLNTAQEEVDDLLRSFWQKMLQPEQEDQDIAELELSKPVTGAEIRLQYRRLAMQHHPDRGGDENRFRTIQAAFQRLKHRYS